MLYTIGYNGEGQFGLGSNQNYQSVTLLPNKEIKNIFPGFSQIVFANDDLTKLWVSGWNDFGSAAINSKEDEINTITPIKYFEENQIRISKVFTGFGAHRVIFLSNNNKLYGAGQNSKYQMGWNQNQIQKYQEFYEDGSKNNLNRDSFNNYVPSLIPHPNQHENVIDIGLAKSYTVALCSSNTGKLLMIIQNWIRMYCKSTPDDIIQLLILFSKYSSV